MRAARRVDELEEALKKPKTPVLTAERSAEAASVTEEPDLEKSVQPIAGVILVK